jgi:hypothetical protein
MEDKQKYAAMLNNFSCNNSRLQSALKKHFGQYGYNEPLIDNYLCGTTVVSRLRPFAEQYPELEDIMVAFEDTRSKV